MCGKAITLTGVKKAAPGAVSAPAWQVGKQKPVATWLQSGELSSSWEDLSF